MATHAIISNIRSLYDLLRISMDPLNNQLFSHDAIKYMYQTPDAMQINPSSIPSKPFELNAPEKAKKTKKDLGKDKEQEKGKQNKKPSIFDLH